MIGLACLPALLVAGLAPRAQQQDWADICAQPAGEARALAMAEWIAQGEGALPADQAQAAWEAAVAEADALRWQSAIPLQRELHRRVQQDWSALNLALSLNRSQGAEAADGVLAAQLPRSHAPAELWSQRGIYWIGADEIERGRNCLGRALALGSSDAAVVLAREDLQRGEVARARAALRDLVTEQPPGPWALRGFGLALLLPSSR